MVPSDKTVRRCYSCATWSPLSSCLILGSFTHISVTRRRGKELGQKSRMYKLGNETRGVSRSTAIQFPVPSCAWHLSLQIASQTSSKHRFSLVSSVFLITGATGGKNKSPTNTSHRPTTHSMGCSLPHLLASHRSQFNNLFIPSRFTPLCLIHATHPLCHTHKLIY